MFPIHVVINFYFFFATTFLSFVYFTSLNKAATKSNKGQCHRVYDRHRYPNDLLTENNTDSKDYTKMLFASHKREVGLFVFFLVQVADCKRPIHRFKICTHGVFS